MAYKIVSDIGPKRVKGIMTLDSRISFVLREQPHQSDPAIAGQRVLILARL